MALELSIFCDESGSDGLDAKYYLLTLVLHNQEDSIFDSIDHYEQALRDKGLPDITFHASPLIYGKKEYKGKTPEERKKLLSAFRVFFRHLPIQYWCLALPAKEYPTPTLMANEMRRQLVAFLFDNLEMLQTFDAIKIYYDNGQQAIADALHKAVDYALAKNAVAYKPGTPQQYRLAQAADYICTVELTALKYADHTTTSTDEKFFGSWSMFKKGVLKEVRAKRL